MSHFLDRLKFFKKTNATFAAGHGVVTQEDRQWEEAYRGRWRFDKVVRPPTASTAPVAAPGTSTSRTGWWRLSCKLPTTPEPGRICLTTNRAAVSAAPVIPGIYTARTGSNTP